MIDLSKGFKGNESKTMESIFWIIFKYGIINSNPWNALIGYCNAIKISKMIINNFLVVYNDALWEP